MKLVTTGMAVLLLCVSGMAIACNYKHSLDKESNTVYLTPGYLFEKDKAQRDLIFSSDKKLYMLSLRRTGECENVEIIDGEPAKIVYVPYTKLYNAYITALYKSQGKNGKPDVDAIDQLFQWYRPAFRTPETAISLLTRSLENFSHGADGFTRMLQLFEIPKELFRQKWMNEPESADIDVANRLDIHKDAGHLAIFYAMGGRIKPACEGIPVGSNLDKALIERINVFTMNRYSFRYDLRNGGSELAAHYCNI